MGKDDERSYVHAQGRCFKTEWLKGAGSKALAPKLLAVVGVGLLFSGFCF